MRPRLRRAWDGSLARTGAAGALGALAAALALAAVAPTGAQAAEACPNEQFRVGPSASLPDCRAYEQVTPVNKGASNDMYLNIGAAGTYTRGLADNQGDRVLLTASASFGPSPDGFSAIDYVFSRSAAGWRFTPVEPPGAGDTHYELQGLGNALFSPDFSLVAPLSLTGSVTTETATTPMGLSFGPPGGPYTTIMTTTAGNDPRFAAATPDFSHIFFTSRDHSLASPAGGLVAGTDALYEWTGGQLRLVNVTTGGSLVSACGAVLGEADLTDGGYGSMHNAVSSDGSKAFFESPEPNTGLPEPSCEQPQHLYMRVNGSETVDVSAPNPGVNDPSGFHPAAYIGAAANGSKVFFVTETELTADDTTHAPELYEYDTESRTLTRVSRGASGSAEGNVQWAVVSEDGSTVYFAAIGQLAPGAPVPTGEEVNLYHYDTATGATSYIGTVAGVDGPQLARGGPPSVNSVGGSFQADTQSNWYATPDGRFLLFTSSVNLTSYNSNGQEELYRYDSAAGSLTCVSCNPSGASATGSAFFTSLGFTSLTAPDIRSQRPMSDDGSRVFFDTPDRLLPADTNSRLDVYEWEADGAGSCHSSAQDGGCLYLISSGKDTTDSIFVDSSSDGSNVFFGTHAQLAPTDTDNRGDLYDARVYGGFPAPPPAPSCAGEGCQGALTVPPLFGPPVTGAIGGSGNLTPAPAASAKPRPKQCKKHFVRRHGRCVRARVKKHAKVHKGGRR
jgi:hypothetical protein